MSSQLKEPKTLKGWNIFIDGYSQAGLVAEGTPPKIIAKMEEFQNAGMMQPQKIALGYEIQEVEFTFTDLAVEVDLQVGEKVDLAFKGAYQTGVDDDFSASEIRIVGEIEEIDRGTYKQGEKTEVKIKMTVNYYKYIYEGQLVHEFDPMNCIYVIGNKDHTKSVRDILFN